MTKPIEEAKTLADWAYIAVSKHFKKISKHEAEVIEDKDPEELHQMRVGTRRLRSTIAGFTHALELPKAASDRKVGKVARILGELRDLDVLEGTLAEDYRPLLPIAEQETLDTAFKVLSKERKKTFEKVKQILHGDLYQNLKFAFQGWLKEPTYREMGKISIDTVLPDLLLPQVSQFLLHPAWLVGVSYKQGKVNLNKCWTSEEVEDLLQHEQGKILHDLRKEAKRTRYNMELFTQFYGDEYQSFIEDVKAIQSVLGAIQDCSVLDEFLTEVFEENLECELPNLVHKFQEIRHEKWNEWRVLQDKFLNPQTRKGFHQVILDIPSRELAAENTLNYV